MDGGFKLKEVIDAKLLKDIQDNMAKITNLAYNIIDFTGNPINKYCNFSTFCNKMRSTPEGVKMCYSANAHAGLEAAIRKEPYIFRCPAGLVDVAVPIIINENYLGAILFGQVRINDSKLLPIKQIEDCVNRRVISDNLKKCYGENIQMEYDKLVSIAKLVQLVVNQLVEKSQLALIKEELNFTNVKLAKEKEERLKLEEILKNYKIKIIQSNVNPNLLLNTLNSISRLAIIENANRTEEITYLLANLIRYASKNSGEKVTIQEELENMCIYLKIQTIIFGKRIRYKIDIDENMNTIKIPSMILQRLVENAVLNGLCPKKNGGMIYIKGYFLKNNIIIEIKDNGVGIPENKLYMLSNLKSNADECRWIQIYNVNEIMYSYYGDEYKMDIKSKVNRGTLIKLKIPFVE
ncbi:histidine kinase [Clostridium novyi A str. 4552]|uniref:Histidine kinase n=1 Tax=Clostridium novyi A str. 4552 TaxID=1444289 RepID=A0A0A0I831_CLONO|nr:PocR ligand-binding domain-containing protein [Clostridium novyi]KGM95775.1 histidine kinase [Clostridium novyi A str. 4552]